MHGSVGPQDLVYESDVEYERKDLLPVACTSEGFCKKRAEEIRPLEGAALAMG